MNQLNRRQWLFNSGGGLGGMALASMLSDHPKSDDRSMPNYRIPAVPRAKRVIQLFMAGATSQIDTFDYKPALEKVHGNESDFGEKIEAFQDGLGPWMKSPWSFKPYGQCGKQISEIVAPLGECVDDIAFVHNMVSTSGVHSQATYLQATGFDRPGFPGMGAWISYGLGNENENLPTFVVLPDHRGYASNGPKNWESAFLPASNQGTIIWPNREKPITDLFPSGTHFGGNDKARLRLLHELNRKHQSVRDTDDRLEARIRSYELAAKMQLAAPEALDISNEPDYILKLYGLDHGKTQFPQQINAVEETEYFSKKCLVARRLIERGVRFVQIWSGNDNGFPRRNWDSHEDIVRDHQPLAIGMATGTAALIKDLKQRGLLDDTIILWTTEFGRLPSSQGGKGRDHNPFVFTNWLCGGGIKGGVSFGPSDQWGYKPLDRDNPTKVYDIHATVLHLLGIDHRQLTMRHNGIDRRLTDVHGHVIDDIIA
jgi:hypothetical protein